MTPCNDRALVLEMKSTGERLTLLRVKSDKGVEELHLAGSLPAHGQGPPLHVHFEQDEHGEVISGTLSASVDGKPLQIPAGGTACFPRGSKHRWWNDGDIELVFRGVATPPTDLDRYLQALFEVLNSGPPGHPPLFYMAHALHRHRHTQLALVVPRALQRLIFPIVIFLGTLLGKYKGTAWPGCPSRCSGAPASSPPG